MYQGEKFNSLSHFAGGLLAAAGAAVLITFAGFSGDLSKILGAVTYGLGMVLVYSASTLYHSTPEPLKNTFRKFDHISIYLMIAGTYTPFCLVTLRESVGYWLLATVWFLAALGAVLEFTLAHRTRVPSLALYFVMSLLSLIALQPLATGIPGSGFLWLVLGGILYFTGFFFYIFDDRVPHFHGIWHLFVIGGSACQYLCVLYCILK